LRFSLLKGPSLITNERFGDLKVGSFNRADELVEELAEVRDVAHDVGVIHLISGRCLLPPHAFEVVQHDATEDVDGFLDVVEPLIHRDPVGLMLLDKSDEALD
jgi:hypothetical protein